MDLYYGHLILFFAAYGVASFTKSVLSFFFKKKLPDFEYSSESESKSESESESESESDNPELDPDYKLTFKRKRI